MLIRKADESDQAQLIALRTEYLTEHFGRLARRETIVAQLAAYYEAHLNRDFFAFLAEEGGNVIACAFLVVQEKPANPRFISGKTGLLLNVYTREPYRRRGAATRLLEAVIEQAEKDGLSSIELTATEAGEPLYRKLGFADRDAGKEMTLVLSGN